MDRPEVKHRVAVSYIVAMVCLIAIVIISQILVNNRAQQQEEDPAAENTSSSTDAPTTESGTDEEEPVTNDGSYPAMNAEFCTYDMYQYRIVTDAEELASFGLPSSVTEEMLGGSFATANDRITLYAYPAYGCRAILIANKGDNYSFCVLDSFTDSTKVQTLNVIPPMFGMNAASDVVSSEVIRADGTQVTLTEEDVEQFYSLLSDCTNAGEKAAVADGVTIALTSRTGVVLPLNYHEDISLISILGEYYTVTEELQTFLADFLA